MKKKTNKRVIFRCFNDYLKYYFPKRYEEERRNKLTTFDRAKEDTLDIFKKTSSGHEEN